MLVNITAEPSVSSSAGWSPPATKTRVAKNSARAVPSAATTSSGQVAVVRPRRVAQAVRDAGRVDVSNPWRERSPVCRSRYRAGGCRVHRAAAS